MSGSRKARSKLRRHKKRSENVPLYKLVRLRAKRAGSGRPKHEPGWRTKTR